MKKHAIFIPKFIFLSALLFILLLFPAVSISQSLEEAKRLYDHSIELHKEGRYQEAIPFAKRAMAILEVAVGKEHPIISACLNELGVLHMNIGEYTTAEPLYNRALNILENVYGHEHPDVASVLNNLASLYEELGDYSRAESMYMRALAIRENSLPLHHPDTATNLNNLAALHYSIGNYSRAESMYMRALAIRREVFGRDHPYVAQSLNNLASLYYSLGDYSHAEITYKNALKIYENCLPEGHPDLLSNIDNLAHLYLFYGDFSRAEHLYKRALAIREKIFGKSHPYLATNLNNLASLYVSRGDFSDAEAMHMRALAIRKKFFGKDHQAVVSSLINLASLYLSQGKTDKAFKILISRQDCPQGLGHCYLIKRQYENAQKEFRKSLNYNLKQENNKLTTEKKFIIADHIGLGLSYEGMGDYTRAKINFKEAINLIESQWQTLSLSARRTFLAGEVGANFTRLDAYEGMVRVIIKDKKRGYQKEALLYAESVKSRTLLEMLAARGAKGMGKKDMDTLKKDRQFQMDITAKKKRIAKIEELGPKAPKGDKEQVEKELNKILQDYEQFINEVKLQDTELASLITVETAPVEKIQSLLDPSTTLLEYFITKDKTYAWLITKDDITVQELNIGNKKLIAMVNNLLLPNISNNTRRTEPVITVSTGGIQDKKTGGAERDRNRKQFIKGTQEFYSSILKPVEDKIPTKNLIVVPHGVLHKVPFSALDDGEKLMVDKYAISTVPSYTAIRYIVKKRSKNNGQLLAFANPKTDYVPLGFAEIEVEQIEKQFSKKEIFSQKEATETRAKQESDSPDVIHFACHGEFNDKQPMQSGLLLAKNKNNDGILQVHELFGLNLKNANLVVLSACDTALSKIQGGDDLVGLSRGFIYAGTPSLMATLWQVDDRSTSMLMECFYENWLQKGLSKPEALRQAQLSIKSTRGYEHPYYWAPFIIIGDWM